MRMSVRRDGGILVEVKEDWGGCSGVGDGSAY